MHVKIINYLKRVILMKKKKKNNVIISEKTFSHIDIEKRKQKTLFI